MFDAALIGIADIPRELSLDVTSRINGFDGKSAIIKAAARNNYRFAKDICRMIEDTCAACELHKRYRDGLIHAHIRDPNDPVAETAQRRGIVMNFS